MRSTRTEIAEAQAMLTGHADASHFGDVDGACPRCVTLAAACGITL